MALVSTTDVKTYLGISSSGDDALIGDLISAAQSIIEDYTHRVFDASSTATKRFDARSDVSGRSLYFGQGLEAAAITSVTNGDGTSLTADTDYIYLPRNAAPYYGLTMLGSSNNFWEGDTNGDSENAISIVANWGYSTSAPNSIVMAAKRLSAFLYRQRDTNSDVDRPLIVDGVTILPSSIPSDVRRMLDPFVMNTL